MAGLAKTEQFQFSVATLMVSSQANQLILNSTAHSLGLVKNVTIETNPSVVDLTQGLENDVVFSAVNNMQFKCSAEVYEYTAQNLAYGLSLDASGSKYIAQPAAVALAGAVAAAATTFTMAADQTSTFTAGSWGFLQSGTDDLVHGFKITSSAYSSPNTTVTITGYPVPTGMSFTTATGRAGVLNKIDADPTALDTPLSARVVGTLIADKRPVILHFPKIRILKGFSMKFDSQSFGNLPFEWTPFTPMASDPGYSTDFPFRMSVLAP